MSRNVSSSSDDFPAGKYIVSFISHDARAKALHQPNGVNLSSMVDREFAGIPAISGTFNSEALALLQRDSDAMGVKCIEKDSLGVASGYTSTSCAQL